MFTGIITAIGIVAEMSLKDGGGVRASIKTPWECEKINLGASIACSGVCLTIVARKKDCFSVDVSEESLSLSSLKNWKVGQKINLERALGMGDEMGGHIVSGHVDGLAEILDLYEDGDSHGLKLRVPDALAPMIASKGSIALDGVSLTVNEVNGNDFSVMIIPHTWSHTTLGECKVGDTINLEVDMLARYVARVISYKVKT
jgi:riboflavin synthase